ncbi:MAG: tRNA 2-thiocytidine(32) synthetase TtcA [Christensenellaceae bacterium]|nr:tRNA 2-thiocytidine(32) synthetase TtcA [Christensenellaceae bacterium]
MKKVLGCIRRASDDYNMIADGDKIAVGLSGGKDSMLLLRALTLYKRFSKKNFDLVAITVDLGFGNFDTALIRNYCDSLGVECHILNTEIADVVFNIRKETNPCSLCAKMRKGALYTAAKELGCNKAAFAHHADDVIETLLLSLFFEGKMRTFLPVTYLSRMDITLIRPLIYLPEQDVINAVAKNDIPIAKSPCPANGNTKREVIKNLVKDLRKINPDIKKSLFAAIKNKDNYLLWDKSGQNNE